MPRAFTAFLALLAAIQIAGGPLAVLQTVAWAGMLVEYSAESGLAEAVKRTFDGQHPCSLCLAVEEERGQEKKQDRSWPWQEVLAKKPALSDAGEVHVLRWAERAGSSAAWPAWVGLLTARTEVPPTPPPIAA